MKLLHTGRLRELSMSTRFLTAGELSALDKWYVIDAADQVLGRVASKAATILTGKHRPQYAPFLVSGDHVIILNAAKVRLTGEKLDKKVYRWHTQYPGGLREVQARKVFETKPERVIREAVLGMLPKNRLRKRFAKRLKVYVADQHPHRSQQPQTLEI
jgi:large subunit ribosomal protein L13